MKYDENSVNYEMQAIRFLQHTGKITREEASYLREYIESLI